MVQASDELQPQCVPFILRQISSPFNVFYKLQVGLGVQATGLSVPVPSLVLRDKEIVTKTKIAKKALPVEQTTARIFIPLSLLIRIVVEHQVYCHVHNATTAQPKL